jgi:hypothetical protein
MVNIRKHLKVIQDRKNIYVYKGREHREFRVGEHVFLKVKDKRSSLKLGSFPKLEVRYCEPFEVLETIDPTTYMFEFPTSMIIHNMFHVSY